MGNQEQRWLSLDAICTTLRLPRKIIRALVKKGCLVHIKTQAGDRYLDPTPEYAEQLRLGAMAHQKYYPIPDDITERALLTPAEISQILGINKKQTRTWLKRHDVPRFQVSRNLALYTVGGVREALWNREDRVLHKNKAPFLIPELVAFFRRYYAAETALVPTDKQFREDDVLQRKLEILASLNDGAKRDFSAKVELARKIVQILEFESVSNTEQTPNK